MARPRSKNSEMFSLNMPNDMRDGLERLAREHDRTAGAQLRCVLAAELRRAERRRRRRAEP
jgi:hypothetical protein